MARRLAKSIALSGTIKEVDPAAEVFGPVSYGFSAYLNLQNAPDWGNYSGAYGRFVEAYLDLMRQASDSAGVRLFGVLDAHRFPEPAVSARATRRARWPRCARRSRAPGGIPPMSRRAGSGGGSARWRSCPISRGPSPATGSTTPCRP